MQRKKTAGGKRKRRGESFADSLSKLLKERISAELLEEMRENAKAAFLNPDMTNDEAIAMSLIKKAMGGDTAAAKFICDAAERSEETEEKNVEIKLVIVDSADGV